MHEMKKIIEKFQPREKDAGLIGKVVQVGQNNVKMEAVLGEGGFACIYKARDVSTGQVFALKHLRLQGDAEAINEVQHEAKTMAKLRGHANILRLRAVAFAGQKGAETDAFMLLDFCPTTLISLLQSCNYQLDDATLAEVFSHVLQGVAHMHRQNPPFAHRDLKVENVLKLPDGPWVLCDFGSATTRAKVYDTAAEIASEEDKIRRMTTPAYRAPEMWDLLSRQRIDTKADIWALGVMLFVLAFGKLPFQGDAKLPILYGKFDMPLTRSTELRFLIQEMLTTDPSKRPDIFTVISKFEAIKRATGGGLLSPASSLPHPSSSQPTTPTYPTINNQDPSNLNSMRQNPMPLHNQMPPQTAPGRQQQQQYQPPNRAPPNPPSNPSSGTDHPDWADFSNQPQVFQQPQPGASDNAPGRPPGTAPPRLTNNPGASGPAPPNRGAQPIQRITSPPNTSAPGPPSRPAPSAGASSAEVQELQDAVLRLQNSTMGDMEAIRMQLKEVVMANKGMTERIKSLEDVVAAQQTVIKRLRAALVEGADLPPLRLGGGEKKGPVEDTLIETLPPSPPSSRSSNSQRLVGAHWKNDTTTTANGGIPGKSSPPRNPGDPPYPNIRY